MSSLNQDHKWVPTHVQVTVLRGRGLRGKGKHGTSDVYTIIQLGKEKYSTCVVEKTTEPEWREECSFELPPGVLESELVLTVMHRAVMGLDVFLGQALIQLEKIYHESRCVKNEWYRLNSKTGKKEKERGNIQVTVQFTRNDLTASMYDLVMKDKSSTFGKLKERIKGKKRATEEDSSSGVLPGGYGSLHRMRQRLPSDGGGEEDYEDDEGGEARRSKMRTFFLRGKLRKSSDTRSSTSLGSESSESSSRGGSLSPTAGISVVVSDLSNSPSNSSNLTADNSPEHIEDPSSLHCEFGDDTSEITIVVPELPLCVNGSHVDRVPPVDPGSGVLQGSLGLGLLQKSLPTSTSLQNLSPISLADLPKGAAGDGRRWSFDKPDDEEKAAIAAALQRQEEEASARHNPQLRIPSYSSTKETKNQQEENSESNSTYRGWFGSKDGKRSLVESPKLGRSCEPPPFGHTVDLVTPLHHTNPFCNSQATPPPLSSCNPFFPFLQQNPFYKDINSTQPLNPALPPLPLLSSARPPITQLFPQATSTSPALTAVSLNVQPILGFDAAGHEASPEEEKQVSNLWDQFVKEPEPDLDESFDMFAAGRLHSPEDTRLGREEKTTTGVEPTTHQNMNPFVNGVPDSSAGTFKHIDLFAFGLDTIPEDESFENNETMNSPVEVNTKGSTNTWTNTNKLSSRSPDPTSSGLGSSSEEDFLSCNSSYSASDKVSPCSSDEAIDSHGSAPESAVIRPVNKSESEETAEGSHEWAIQSSDVDEASGASLLTQTSVFTEASGAGLSVNSSVESSLPEPPVSSEPHAQQDSSILPTFDDVEQKRSSPQLLDCQGSPEAPDVDLFPNSPSLFITTSSPDAQHQDSPFESTTVGTLDISSHVMFDLLEFPAAVDTSLLHTQTSERSSAPQSLNVSTDSQRFHSCHSNPFTSSFDMQELNSADSTLRGESSEIVAATDFGLEDTMNPRRTSTGEVNQSESSDAAVDQKETSQPSMTNAPQGPASPGNSSGATGTESTDDKPLEVQDDLWGTPTGEVQPSEGSGAVVDSQETSFKITDDLATQDPAAWTSFGDSLTDSVVEQPACDKDLERSPSGDTQHSEGKTVDQTETLEPSLKITNDLFPPEPSPTSNVSDSSLTKSVVDVRDDDLWGTSAGEVHQSDGVGVAMAQTNTSDPSYAFTSDPFPLDPAAWSSSTGPLFTESVVENPWGVLDPWADAMEQKQTSQPSFITISDIISLEPVSTSSGGARTESGLADPWAFRVDDPWTVPAGEIQRSVSVGLAVDRPSAILTNDLFPQDFTATSTNLSDWTDSGVETPWGDTGRGRHRSQSVGAPSSTFNKERPPLSERDSVMLQESYSSQPDLSTFTSSAPSFIPEHGSFSLPPHSNTSARSPDTVGTAAPALASAQPFLQEVEPLQQEANQQTSPHPVKPLTSATPAEEKRSEGRSVLEKLKSTISPGKNSHASEQEAERRKSLTGGAGSYYHLTHSELVALLVRREAELERQKLQFQQQKTLLAKREMELRRLKPQVRDLEDYIDTLLVRIMEQKPTLLQVRTRLK